MNGRLDSSEIVRVALVLLPGSCDRIRPLPDLPVKMPQVYLAALFLFLGARAWGEETLVGSVKSVHGGASIQRGQASIAIKEGAHLFLNDLLQTGKDGRNWSNSSGRHAAFFGARHRIKNRPFRLSARGWEVRTSAPTFKRSSCVHIRQDRAVFPRFRECGDSRGGPRFARHRIHREHRQRRTDQQT